MPTSSDSFAEDDSLSTHPQSQSASRSSPLLDIKRVIEGGVAVLMDLRHEARAQMRDRVERFGKRLGFVSRDEFTALQKMYIDLASRVTMDTKESQTVTPKSRKAPSAQTNAKTRLKPDTKAKKRKTSIQSQ